MSLTDVKSDELACNGQKNNINEYSNTWTNWNKQGKSRPTNLTSTTSTTTTRVPSYNPPTNTNFNPFINVVRDREHTISTPNPIVSSHTAVSDTQKNLCFLANFPTLLRRYDVIKIPKKVEPFVKKHIPKRYLRAIHEDLDVAVELCLLFVSQLTSTYFTWKTGENPEGWKKLHSKYLRELVFVDNKTYVRIREALEFRSFEDSIIECDYVSQKNVHCYSYRLSSNIIGKGIKDYELKTDIVRDLAKKNHAKKLKWICENEISRHLLEFYERLQLPTEEEINRAAKKLVSIGYKTNKGKKLTFLNKKARKSIEVCEHISYVEDSIELFKYLTEQGLMIPRKGSRASGGRVVDSLTLMPAFIRALISIEGEYIVVCDYSAFHPNIAVCLYGGKSEFLTHQQIAEESGLDKSVVKKEHLSFFNKHPGQMKNSPLYEYYMKKEPEMMRRLIDEKYTGKEKHKITSRRMLAKEVEIMTDVILCLASEGIRVGYVYDALICHPRDAERVSQVMNDITLKHGVMTTAKVS